MVAATGAFRLGLWCMIGPRLKWGRTELFGYVSRDTAQNRRFRLQARDTGRILVWLLDQIIVQHPKAAHSLFAG